MDFGVFLPVSGRAASRGGLTHAARKAEELGFTAVWAADRIVIPWRIETTYNYNWSGQFFVPPEAAFLEPLTVLAFLAGATERIRLGVSVLVGPYRDPVYWSKVVASIDQLSEGRFVLGFGVGWMPEEFAALGRAEHFAPRGRVADEQLAIFRTLTRDEHASHDGEFFAFDDVAFQPKGFRGPGSIPVWVGGEARPSQRRAGRAGDAWFPYFPRVTPDELARRYAYVLETAEAAGRDPHDVALHCCLSVEVTPEPVEQEPDLLRGSPEQVVERLAAFAEVGVQHCALQFLVGRYPERVEQMERFAAQARADGLLG
ncbi:MAG TPA: TIGR03619 family F420-dependent LLM class oxidoreductase [Solirubrobacteraceae bacterium]|nr:TIGR03619 family F420-dependent LLM class oxidoreductase [Solirubrobacteraceae bacterium]